MSLVPSIGLTEVILLTGMAGLVSAVVLIGALVVAAIVAHRRESEWLMDE
jgi:uncharacterized membrane protein YphA (DoxX/SURF4 family)